MGHHHHSSDTGAELVIIGIIAVVLCLYFFPLITGLSIAGFLAFIGVLVFLDDKKVITWKTALLFGAAFAMGMIAVFKTNWFVEAVNFMLVLFG
jgi:hypothetical protein